MAEFSELSGSRLLDEDRQLEGSWEDRRIRSEEREAAALRMGPLWARRLVVDAKSRAGASSAVAQKARLTPTQTALAQSRAARKARRQQRKTA